MTYEEGDLDGACGVCGRALEWVTDQRGYNGHWVHSSEDQILGVDHEPVHVSEKDINPIYRCDFCSADNPEFEIAAHTFQQSAVPGATSVGNWMCCADCKPFVDDDAWLALVERVLVHNKVMADQIAQGNYRESDIRSFLVVSYGDLRQNMIHKPVPIGTVPKWT